MEQTHILERLTPTEELENLPSETEYALNVAMVYQDAATREWAGQVCAHATRLAGKDAVHSAAWDIRRLSEAAVCLEAVQTATRADVIVVSLYENQVLPAGFYDWIDGWLAGRRLPMGALIALINVCEAAGTWPHPIHNCLRAVALQGQLDFLLRERRLPGPSGGGLFLKKARGLAGSRIRHAASGHKR